jgi:hypothetical protein
VTKANEGHVEPDSSAQTDGDQGSPPSAMRPWQQNGRISIAAVGGIARIRTVLPLLAGLLCFLVFGLSGCGAFEISGGEADGEEIPGIPAPGTRPPQEIPGVPGEGVRPPQEIPGVPAPGTPPPTEPSASRPEGEIPGVSPEPTPPGPPPPCVDPVGPFNGALCEALDRELDAIMVQSPSDASERLDLLASLSSSPLEAAIQLEDYEWLSAGAEGVFGGANSLRGTE